ncbi:MAG TPA: hypothetical protein VIF62_19820 [Labilithrix sp.]
MAKKDKSLANVRSVLRALKLKSEETSDPATQTTFFAIDTGVSELDGIQILHRPGLVAAYALFGVRPPASRAKEVEKLTLLWNRSTHTSTLTLRETGQVALRVAVDYSRVKELEGGYVAGLISEIVELVPAVDMPLILISKGKTAAAAVDEVLVIAEATISWPPETKAKKTKKKAAAKRRR